MVVEPEISNIGRLNLEPLPKAPDVPGYYLLMYCGSDDMMLRFRECLECTSKRG